MKRFLAAYTVLLLGFFSCDLFNANETISELEKNSAGIPRNDIRTGYSTSSQMSEESTFFSTVYIEECATIGTVSDGDLWPSAWSDDGYLYSANGDGRGFNLNNYFGDLVVNRISGNPLTGITGTRLAGSSFDAHSSVGDIGSIWNDPLYYNRKPTGMISVNGVLYLAVQDLHWSGTAAFNDAPAASIYKSTDKGQTWTWDTSGPMFDNYIFTTIMFLDFGKDNQFAKDDYVYAYGIDYNWRDSFNDAVPDPTELYLARVPSNSIMDRTQWEFYSGDLSGTNPQWSANIANKRPVLIDDRRVYTMMNNLSESPRNMTVISQGSIVYNQPLNRYIYSSWTEYTFEFYEAPSPWGPWKLFMTKDYGGYPWDNNKNGGYSTTIPSKFISTDGKTMYVQSNTFMGGQSNYGFSLRKLVVEPHINTNPSNNYSSRNLADPQESSGTIPICKSNHFGNIGYLNDGTLYQSEDSWDNETKAIDWWGYTWPRTYSINQVEYTTGKMFSDGGWFEDIKVQVRQDFHWVDVSGTSVTPLYPNSQDAGSNKTYTFTFNNTWGDGVRIIGTPGGTQHFTSQAELKVFYRDSGESSSTDDFSGPLDSVWFSDIPQSGPVFSFSNGNLRLSLPDTGIFDQWINIDNAPKILRTDMGNGDWTIETSLKLSSYTQNTNFHEGLFVKFDENDYGIWGNLMGYGLELSRSGDPAMVEVPYYDNSVILRLRKSGTNYFCEYKINVNDPWIIAGFTTINKSVESVGLIAKTWSPVLLSADFDYFTLSVP